MLLLGHKGSSSLNKHLVDWETPDILVATCWNMVLSFQPVPASGLNYTQWLDERLALLAIENHLLGFTFWGGGLPIKGYLRASGKFESKSLANNPPSTMT